MIHVLLLQVSAKCLNHYCTTKIRTNNSTNIICDFIFTFLVTVNKGPINIKNTGEYILTKIQILVMMLTLILSLCM